MKNSLSSSFATYPPTPPRVKVMPLSCHCKLKTLVPMLQQLLQAAEPYAEPKAKTTRSTSCIPFSIEFRYP